MLRRRRILENVVYEQRQTSWKSGLLKRGRLFCMYKGLFIALSEGGGMLNWA